MIWHSGTGASPLDAVYYHIKDTNFFFFWHNTAEDTVGVFQTLPIFTGVSLLCFSHVILFTKNSLIVTQGKIYGEFNEN